MLSMTIYKLRQQKHYYSNPEPAMMNCPKCNKEMEHIDDEPDVNVVGGYVCHECDEFIPQWDVDDEP